MTRLNQAIHNKNFWTAIGLFVVTVANQYFGMHLPTSTVAGVATVAVGLIGARTYMAAHNVDQDLQKMIRSQNFWSAVAFFLVGLANQYFGMHLPSTTIVGFAVVVFGLIAGHSYLASKTSTANMATAVSNPAATTAVAASSTTKEG